MSNGHPQESNRAGFRAVCLNAKSSEERVVYKKLNSTNVDSENNHGGSSKDICITSDWMFTSGRSVTA